MLNVTKDVLQHFTSDLGPLSSAAIGLASLVVACWSARSAWLRWLTFRAHSPLPLVTRLLSGFVQAYSYDEDGFYGADGAPLEVQERRRRALEELKQRFDAQVGPKAAQLNERLRELSDIRFTDTNRVPHCFQPVMRAKLRVGFISVAKPKPNPKPKPKPKPKPNPEPKPKPNPEPNPNPNPNPNPIPNQVLAALFLANDVYGMLQGPQSSKIAHSAHLGGALFGAVWVGLRLFLR